MLTDSALPSPARGTRRSRGVTRRDFLSTKASPQESGYLVRVSRRAMACRFEITLGAEHASWVPAARAALDGVDRLEDLLSVFRATSAICDVNRRAASEPVQVDADLFDLLEQCAVLHRDTSGTFDITSTPLSRCWGFLQREGRLPPQDAIDAARASVGYDAVSLEAATRSVRFMRTGVELNLGAIGKGYALDRVAAGMREAGVPSALLSAGRSSLLALGGRWQVEVVSPQVSEGPLARVWLRDAAIGTSGAGEQFVIVDGRRYGHVIDPRTGWPAAGVVSASVITSSAASADALSTAFLIGGVEFARRYCADNPGVLAIVTPEDHRTTPLTFGACAGATVR